MSSTIDFGIDSSRGLEPLKNDNGDLSGRNNDYKEDFYNKRSNNVQKCTIFLVAFVIIMLIILMSLSSAIFHTVDKIDTSAVTVAYQSLGLPGYEKYAWNDIETLGSGRTVNFWMYGGASQINDWVDNWLGPRVLAKYDITIVRNDGAAAGAAAQVGKERSEKNDKDGSVDMIWINGENYYNMRTANNLYGPWAERIPNAENFDFTADSISFDFGNPIQGYEMPYTGAQIVFICNSKYVNSSSIQSMDDLVTWTKNNPGKFTYAAPGSADAAVYDYTGSAFIRHFLYEFCGADPSKCNYRQYLGNYKETLYNTNVKYAFSKLKEMESYLYKDSSTNVIYPATNDDVDDLFTSGKIWITLSYDPAHPGDLVSRGIWPEETTTWLPASGTIANTNYIAIPYNAKNQLSAILVSNYIASLPAMFSRRDPAGTGYANAQGWGAMEPYNTQGEAFITEGWDVPFAYLESNQDAQTLSAAVLAAKAMPELDARYTLKIQADWYKCVIQKSTSSPCV